MNQHLTTTAFIFHTACIVKTKRPCSDSKKDKRNVNKMKKQKNMIQR